MTATKASKKHMAEKVAVVSFSPIAHDRRVRRQCALLREMGHDVLMIGYGAESDGVAYPCRCWPVPQPSFKRRLATVARKLPAHLGLSAAQKGFWSEPQNRWALSHLQASAPRLIIANDWPALAVAAAHKRSSRALLIYDSHEFAQQEFANSAWWRIVHRPMATLLESEDIRAADRVVTVGNGLARALEHAYALAQKVQVVRNCPERIALTAPTDTRWPLRILYHGNISPGRGLEELICSKAFWKTPHTLTLRGNGAPAYLDMLRKLANAQDDKTIVFEPAVAPGDVIAKAAATADLGVFFSPLESIQQKFTMPNKLFEYILAGLAVAISPAPDMREIVEHYGLGVISTHTSPQAIADTMNSLTLDSVTAFKTKARAAATELCWETEKEKLRAVIENLLITAAGRDEHTTDAGIG